MKILFIQFLKVPGSLIYKYPAVRKDWLPGNIEGEKTAKLT